MPFGKEAGIPYDPTKENTTFCLGNCLGACCRNMWFHDMDWDELQKLIPPHALSEETDTLDKLSYYAGNKDSNRKNVYYFHEKNDLYTAFIAGPCPNLLPDNRCAIYEERPEHCRNLEIGSQSCNKSRKLEFNLPPIIDSTQPAEKPLNLTGSLAELFNKRNRPA